MAELVVRPMAAGDVKAVRDLHAAVLPVHYPPAFFLQLLIMPQRRCLVAADRAHPSTPIAFVSAAIHPDRIELLTLGVAVAHRQRGLATLLVKQLVALNARAGGTLTCANVCTTNPRAIAFYRRMGLHVIPQVLRGFYRTASGPGNAYLVIGVL